MRLFYLGFLPLVALLPLAALAAEPIALTIEDGKFTPDHITFPAGEKMPVMVTNHNKMPAEFESFDFKVEKIIVPGGTIKTFLGPIKPGTYSFFDDYHPETKGTAVVTGARQ